MWHLTNNPLAEHNFHSNSFDERESFCSSRSWTLVNFNNLPFYKSALRLSTFVRFMHFVEKTRWQFCSFGSMWWKSDLQYQEIRISHCWSQIIDVLSIIDHIHVYEERSMTTLTTMMMMTSAAFNVFSMWVRLSRLQLLPFVTWEQGDGSHGSWCQYDHGISII